MQLVENLKWRYATKKFDSSRKISQQDLDKIKEAVRLSASSFGLQPYKVLIIEDSELRRKLKSVSWEQSQITEASQLVVFCNYTAYSPQIIDDYINLISEIRGVTVNSLQGFSKMMKSALSTKPKEEFTTWASKQTYLALGILLAACAELKIDACPMEGFDSRKYNNFLNLTEQGLSASVIATIGFRSSEDVYQHAKKVRKPVDKLFEIM